MISPVEVIWAKEVIRRRRQRVRHRPQRLGRGHPGLWSAPRPALASYPRGDAHPAGRRDHGRGVRRHGARHLAAGSARWAVSSGASATAFTSSRSSRPSRTAPPTSSRAASWACSNRPPPGCYGLGFLLAGVITTLTSVRVTFAATAVGVILATILDGPRSCAGPRPRSPVESHSASLAARHRDLLEHHGEREAVVALLAPPSGWPSRGRVAPLRAGRRTGARRRRSGPRSVGPPLRRRAPTLSATIKRARTCSASAQVEVLRVARLVGVDEDQVERAFARRPQARAMVVSREADVQLDHLPPARPVPMFARATSA